MEEFGEPVQVVNMVEGSNKYELNEELLKSVLMQENIKDVPVVVVSIAGAFRGGKSFLLNFFLKYILSKYVDNNDNWTQKGNTPLEGFKWRGGAERETVGIYIWSRPVYASLPCGTKVAILLMDTQGIFDSSSTMRDCTTIFALSTLLSSVQIYNLKEHIQEDHLHSLQLFTEYGKMARDNDFQPMQNLKFLVRDWSWEDEYPFGAEGGRQLLLDKVLKVKDSQPKELKDIRQQIKSCFHKVDCFLMPHPGLDVFKKDFKGRFADISLQFQASLRELLSSIFDPENLTIKMINNQSVSASELLGYFKTYTNIFNSDEILEPITIAKATAMAGLQMAQSKALFKYTQAMDTVCDERTPRVPTSSLHRLHRDEKAQAIQFFNSRRMMSFYLKADDHLNALIEDIDVRLPYYVLMNNKKFTKILADVTKAYEIVMEELLVGDHECVHPQDLITTHQKAFETAIKLYEERIIPPEDQDEDEKKNGLIKVLQDRISELMVINDSRNIRSVNVSYEKYELSMNGQFGEQLCANWRLLQRKHEEEYESARNFLYSKRRNSSEEHLEDLYLSDLEQRINVRFDFLREINERNNLDAVNAATECYGDNMPQLMPCWHPQSLQEKHETAYKNALEVLHSWRTSDTINEDDDQITEVTEITSHLYQQIQEVNINLNKDAENIAKKMYDDLMTSSCQPFRIRMSDVEFATVHSNHSAAALANFRSRRHHSQEEFLEDEYILRVKQYIDGKKFHFYQMNARNPYISEIFNIIVGLAGVVFLRRTF